MNKCFDDSITLSRAIQELRALEQEGNMADKLPAEVLHIFDQHDAVHILFNCGTSLEDEIAAHVWMLFATTADIGEMHRTVATQQHRSVLSSIGHLKLLSTWFFCLPRVIGIIFKSLRMKKKLAVENLSKLKEQSILEIRREHGILL
ncbi:hypothetical protein ABN584_20190 [Gloeocapsa sp. BRSZ]|uniref:hypothetical protein n=1 Tax=Gloeocapsopsis sp. IPPAS B-1203 TaxID=2049454 RepID=UPI000C1916A0|nr:hypothetical protein [Gloeocapsopsis sp. IPPAS B-1203]PIG91617.1 hypothetical protein CSQ79_20510 [Gloeocapsopsis sp. IPPAS B-1203]